MVILFDSDSRILTFSEKDANSNLNFVSAGIYCMQKNILHYFPERDSFSIEYDFFSEINNNRCYAFVTILDFHDIGTPDNYKIFSDIKLKEGYIGKK